MKTNKNSLFSRALYLYTLLVCSLVLSCKKEKEEKTEPTVSAPVKVVVMDVSPTTETLNREYSGTVSSAETSTASFSISGTITELNVKEGQKVSKGQVLGKVRSGDYQNAYNIARAQLAEAQDAYNRLKILHDANALPEVKWVEMEQKLKQAQNTVEIAQRTLGDIVLHSPANGTITTKFADIGQTVIAGQPIFQIVSTNNLEVDITVSESEIGSFNVGQKALVSMEALGERKIEGTVNRKTVVADPLTRSFTVKVGIPNTQGQILPGMLGKVMFPSPGVNDSTMTGINLPSQAVLLNEDNRWFVWVVNDSVAERRFVTADQLSSTGVIVKSGINTGDKVIVEGMQKIGTGTRVTW